MMSIVDCLLSIVEVEIDVERDLGYNECGEW